MYSMHRLILLKFSTFLFVFFFLVGCRNQRGNVYKNDLSPIPSEFVLSDNLKEVLVRTLQFEVDEGFRFRWSCGTDDTMHLLNDDGGMYHINIGKAKMQKGRLNVAYTKLMGIFCSQDELVFLESEGTDKEIQLFKIKSGNKVLLKTISIGIPIKKVIQFSKDIFWFVTQDHEVFVLSGKRKKLVRKNCYNLKVISDDSIILECHDENYNTFLEHYCATTGDLVDEEKYSFDILASLPKGAFLGEMRFNSHRKGGDGGQIFNQFYLRNRTGKFVNLLKIENVSYSMVIRENLIVKWKEKSSGDSKISVFNIVPLANSQSGKKKGLAVGP